ncbi:MAG: SDR family NAD(P)-dependent oxidoreductase [Pseudomonadota bacterium]
MHVLIAAGSGGIGRALVAEVAARWPSAEITATWRSEPPPAKLPGVRWLQVDLTDEAQVASLAESIESPRWVINAAGVLHTDAHGPEKSIRAVNADFFVENMRVNVLPTLLLAKHFHRRFPKQSDCVFATLSARVGSIEDNRLGGWTSYRCSKAALNMALKNISIEWGRTAKQVAVVALHPGTTDTALSKPFQAGVAEQKLFSAEKTAGLLIDVVASLTPEHTGQFLAYDGSPIPW